ncbi:MAG: V-type ATPase subunit [Clostridia bacterium]|nr:V-type ATPase subunit [Clostridia bacterium]
MQQGLLFQNAIIKARESALFGKDKMQRLSDAPTVEEGVKILLEGGYPAGNDYLEILAAAEKEAEEFFLESSVSGYGLECFSVLSDYHNAKVLAKEAFFDVTAECFKADGSIALSFLSEKIQKEEYDSLPSPMRVAFEKFKKENAAGSLAPSEIDKSLDRAAFEDISARMKKAHLVIRTYFATYADLTNLSVAARSRNAGISAAEAEKGYLAGGEIPFQDLKRIVDLGLSEGADKIPMKPLYKKAIEALKEGVAPFEAFKENALLAPFKKGRYDMFSPAPIVGFYLGKKREIKNVRLIFAGIKNGVDREIIKMRLREQYV